MKTEHIIKKPMFLDAVQRLNEYITNHNEKYDFHLVKYDFNLVSDNENHAHIEFELKDKTMNFVLITLVEYFNERRQKFFHIYGMNITTISF